MKVVKALSLAVTLLAFAVSGMAATTVCNFDSFSGQATVPDGYCGVTWGGNWTYYDGYQPPYNPSSNFERVYDFVNVANIVLPSASVFQGAYFSGYGFATVTFNLYNGANLVWTSATLAPSSTPTWLASGYSGLVTSVDVVSPSPDYFVMDDFTYGTPTPEPGTLGLLASGAIGAAGMIRRRFAK